MERNRAFLSGIKKLANKVTGADNAEKLSENVMGTANSKLKLLFLIDSFICYAVHHI